MKKTFFSMLVTIFIFSFVPIPAEADFWGGDLPLLTQILTNALQQLAQLKSILGTAQDNLELLKQVNQGINDSLSLMSTIAPYVDPGTYKDWDKLQAALGKISSIYGEAVPSLDHPIQKDTDQEVAEAILLNNSMYKYSENIDSIGEQIKIYSHQVSPGGAQKLTAQTLGIMLNVMNEGLRAQATGLKLTAQGLALQNHKDKEATRSALNQARILKNLMAEEPVTYETPVF